MVAVNAEVQANLVQGESLTDRLKTAFLDYFFPERPARMLPLYEQHKQWDKAAECAQKLRQYERAILNYDRAGTHLAYQEALHLTKWRGDYQKALYFAQKDKDLVEEGYIQAHLGRPEETLRCWQLIYQGQF